MRARASLREYRTKKADSKKYKSSEKDIKISKDEKSSSFIKFKQKNDKKFKKYESVFISDYSWSNINLVW